MHLGRHVYKRPSAVGERLRPLGALGQLGGEALRAAIYHGPGDIRLEELPRPRVGPRDILVEMRACGLCGSDLMDWYLAPRAPLVLGHEPTGVVVEVGREVEGFSEGDRVFAHHHVSCTTCRFCRRGQFTLCPQFRRTHLDPGGFA